MVCLKGFQRDIGLYLSIVNAEDAPVESGSSFLIHRSLHRPKAVEVPHPPVKWRGVPMMALRHVIYRAYTMIGPS